METSEMQFGKRRLGTNSVLFEYVSRPYSRFSAIRPSVVSFQLTQAATRHLVRRRRVLRLQISMYCTTTISPRPGFLVSSFSAFISKYQVKLVYEVRFLTWIRERHTIWMVTRISTLGFLLFLKFFQAREGHYLLIGLPGLFHVIEPDHLLIFLLYMLPFSTWCKISNLSRVYCW